MPIMSEYDPSDLVSESFQMHVPEPHFYDDSSTSSRYVTL